MMTKTQFCESIIVAECGSLNNFNPTMIGQSSKVAIAAEYLGLLTSSKDIEYAKTRGGSFNDDVFTYIKNKGTDAAKIYNLSVRDVLYLLPETL